MFFLNPHRAFARMLWRGSRVDDHEISPFWPHKAIRILISIKQKKKTNKQTKQKKTKQNKKQQQKTKKQGHKSDDSFSHFLSKL